MVPLRLTPTGPGVYAIHRQWPRTGVWILAINGEALNMKRSLIVELGPNGRVGAANGSSPPTRSLTRKLTAAGIGSAVEALARSSGGRRQAAKPAR